MRSAQIMRQSTENAVPRSILASSRSITAMFSIGHYPREHLKRFGTPDRLLIIRIIRTPYNPHRRTTFSLPPPAPPPRIGLTLGVLIRNAMDLALSVQLAKSYRPWPDMLARGALRIKPYAKCEGYAVKSADSPYRRCAKKQRNRQT